MLKQRLEALESEYHRNNFEGGQDFNKASRFNTSLQVPLYAASPSTCNVGQLYSNTTDGKLYHCSAADTWTAQT
jgi:hypothetical protein